MVVCCKCIEHFHVECLGVIEKESIWKCSNCSMECHRAKKLRRTASAGSSGGKSGLLDMNASPPREIDGDDVGVYANPELASTDSAPKMQDTCGNTFVGFSSTSTNTCTDLRCVINGFPSSSTSNSKMQIARLNLDIATQNANSVYLLGLKDYISERRGVLGDDWRVKFEYSESICKTYPIYCAPDGSRFDSMAKVAHHLGLLSDFNSFETNENGSSICRESKSMSQSRVSNGNAVEADHMENDNLGSESFIDGFPVQFEDFFVTSIGKIDTRPTFHNTSQIWPIGYKSLWHDKLTGSIFICNVLDNGDCGPTFRVNRYPCTKQSIPNASTVFYKSKCGPADESASCLTLTTECALPLPSDNFINGDLIGEFSVDGRSISSAWKLVIETLICACHQTFQDLNVLKFCCNHHSVDIDSQHFRGSYSIDSLDKFGCLTGQINSIPSSILTVEQLKVSCMVLRRWLQMDRFGLDAEFVQELIEQLPGVNACLEYKSLNERCQNSTSYTVKSGFLMVLQKYYSQPMVSDSLIESGKRPDPPGNAIASNIPPGLIGDVFQAYEFCLRFHKVLGLESPLSRQNLEYELLKPWVDGLNSPNSRSIKSSEDDKVQYLTSCSIIAPDTKAHNIKWTGVILSNFHMATLKVLVEDMLAKIVINDPCGGAMESKSKKGRKKNMSGKKVKVGIFPVNEITWPEIARRYILVLLSMDDNLESLDITTREFDEIFHCLNGDGGPLCGSLTGMAKIEADALVLAEASKKIFASVKCKIADFIIDKEDVDIKDSGTETKSSDNKCPEWVKVLEPIRRQPTNVGARIRNRVYKSLEKGPPEWAKVMLLESISKDVYKGNAAGPTKKIVVTILEKVRDENPLTKKRAKESGVIKSVSDVISKRCRMVIRAVAAEDENKSIFGLTAGSLMKPNESDDDFGHQATVSCLLDFRTIDLRLDAGFYAHSHESFIEDVHEVWQNLRIFYRKKPKYLGLIESFSKKLQELYEQEVLTLVNKNLEYGNNSSLSSEETKKELNRMVADTIRSTLFVAPWEDRICKVCGKDENDHILLLCDRCDAEYHTYCLDPPLQRVPKSSWYCPSCILFITIQTMSQEEDCDTLALSQSQSQSQTPEKKKIQREFTRNGLEALADLADAMESKEYWELGVKERVFLLQFLCDEALSSSVIRNHISSDDCDVSRNFLGRDSSGRLYWVLGRPERLFVSGPHSEDEVCVASESPWICYELDAEIEALVEWLRDDDAREKELKETIIKWQKFKSNNHNGQIDMQVNCLRSSVYDTNARAELKKKIGSFIDQDGSEGKIVHSTFFNNELHQCDGSNGNPSFIPKDALQDNNAAFLVKHGINSNMRSTGKQPINESPSEVDWSNPDGIMVKPPSCSSGNTNTQLAGGVSEILMCLKITLLDIEAALPSEAFRPSRRDSDRLQAWRAFLKSAQSIYEMVQASIVLEDMIKTEHLRKEWWYWSSSSSASKISTVSSLALHIYALDAAILYEKPPTPLAQLTQPVVELGEYKSKEQTPKKSNLKRSSSSLTMETSNNSETTKKKSKKKLEILGD